MRYKLSALALFLTAAALLSCNGGGSSGDERNFDKNASYALGLSVGSGLFSDLNANKVYLDYDELLKGIRDGVLDKKPRFSVEEAEGIIRAAVNAIEAKEIEKAVREEDEFLAENAQKSGITITPSGLRYEIINNGSGPRPSEKDNVLVHYTGTFRNGSVFDSTFPAGEPASFRLDQVIPGWTEGIQLMNTGSKYKFYLPSNLAYGAEGDPMTGGRTIPPYSTLIFEVELLEINPK